jgi:hypothetical protein
MTPTAWAQGATNAAVCALVLLAVVALGGGLLAWATGLPMRYAAAGAFGAVFVAANLAFYAGLALDRRRRGQLLLDCGPHPTRWLFAVEGGLLLVVAVATLRYSPLLGSLLAAPAVLFLVFANGRLQVRENGIWQYWSLLSWDRVASYRWSDDATLIVTGRGPFHSLRGALPVPPESQAEVKTLLAKYAPEDPMA